MFKRLYRAVRQFVENVETLNQNFTSRDKSTEELNSSINKLLEINKAQQADKGRRASARDQLALLLGQGSTLVRTQDFAAVQSWEENTTAHLNTLEPSFKLRFQNPNADQTSSRSRDVAEEQTRAHVSLLNDFISELQD